MHKIPPVFMVKGDDPEVKRGLTRNPGKWSNYYSEFYITAMGRMYIIFHSCHKDEHLLVTFQQVGAREV